MFTRDDLTKHALPGSPPDIRWHDFHDREHSRFAIGAPKVEAGIKYATDSRVCIAALSDEPDTPPVTSAFDPPRTLAFPPVGKLLQKTLATFTTWRPWPEVDLAEMAGRWPNNSCPDCRGIGHLEYRSCEHCPEFDVEGICSVCRGEGIVGAGPFCPTCGGDKNKFFPGLQLLPSGGVISNDYDLRVRRLGHPLECHSTRSWVMFRGPGFVGMLMAMDLERCEIGRRWSTAEVAHAH